METVESIGANHMEMARFQSRDDEGYRANSSILRAFMRQELEDQRTPSIHPAAVSSK